jgi:hypothetical protein
MPGPGKEDVSGRRDSNGAYSRDASTSHPALPSTAALTHRGQYRRSVHISTPALGEPQSRGLGHRQRPDRRPNQIPARRGQPRRNSRHSRDSGRSPAGRRAWRSLPAGGGSRIRRYGRQADFLLDLIHGNRTSDLCAAAGVPARLTDARVAEEADGSGSCIFVQHDARGRGRRSPVRLLTSLAPRSAAGCTCSPPMTRPVPCASSVCPLRSRSTPVGVCPGPQH